MLINRLPSLGAWLYTESRRTGFDVGLDFVQGRARVGCYIRLPGGGGKPANIAALLALNERKEDIEAQFGGTLEWLELPDKTGTRICAFFDGSPNLPEEMWPVLQDEMIDALIRLDAALQRPIAEIALYASNELGPQANPFETDDRQNQVSAGFCWRARGIAINLALIVLGTERSNAPAYPIHDSRSTLEAPAAAPAAEHKLSQLEQLKQFSKVVSDTGDFGAIKAFTPQDATTNPSLIFAAVQKEEYQPLLVQAVKENANSPLTGVALTDKITSDLLILFGTEILKIVPGRVSTETDARLSFDVDGLVAKGRELIGLYAKHGIGRERVLIKIASTWEGIRAAEILQKEGIKCNLTLLFSVVQAAAWRRRRCN